MRWTVLALVVCASLDARAADLLSLCRTDAWACEHASRTLPAATLEAKCKAKDKAACVIVADAKLGRPMTDKVWRVPYDVLVKACAGGFIGACGLQAKHAPFPEEFGKDDLWAGRREHWARTYPPQPSLDRVEAACVAGEPLSCMLRAGYWNEYTRGHIMTRKEIEALTERSWGSDDHPYKGKELYERATATAKKACAAGSPRACAALVRYVDSRDTPEVKQEIATNARTCAQGVYEACVVLWQKDAEAEVAKALGVKSPSAVSNAATKACERGDGAACRLAGLSLQTRSLVEWGRVLRKAWQACGRGCCRLAEEDAHTCAGAVKDFGTQPQLIDEEDECREWDRDACESAAERHAKTDKEEARRFGEYGCRQGSERACKRAIAAGAPEEIQVHHMLWECNTKGDSYCALTELTKEQESWLTEVPDARSRLERRCQTKDPKSCALLSRALAAGTWGPKDPIAALDPLAEACMQGHTASCEELAWAAKPGPTQARADELLCFAGIAGKCTGASVPTAVARIDWKDSTKLEVGGWREVHLRDLALSDGYVVQTTRAGGYVVAELASGRVVDRVETLSSAEKEFDRPSNDLRFSWKVTQMPRFFHGPAGLSLVAGTYRSIGRWGTSSLTTWVPGGTPTEWKRELGSVFCWPWRVTNDGARLLARVDDGCDYGDGFRIETFGLPAGAPGEPFPLEDATPLALSRDGMRLVYEKARGSGFRSVWLYDASTKTSSPVDGQSIDDFLYATFDPSGTRLALFSAEGDWMWDLSGKPKQLFPLPATTGFATFSPDGKLLAVASAGGAQLVDASTGAFRSARFPGEFVRAVFSDDGAFVAFGGDTSIVVQLDPSRPLPKPGRVRPSFKRLEQPPVKVPEERDDGVFAFHVRCGKDQGVTQVSATPSKGYDDYPDVKHLRAKLKPWTAISDAEGKVEVKGIVHGLYDLTVSSGSCKHDYTWADFSEEWGNRRPDFYFTSDE